MNWENESVEEWIPKVVLAEIEGEWRCVRKLVDAMDKI